jgi:hypothetical protein
MSSQLGNASLAAVDLFNVDGLVVFITGAGTGEIRVPEQAICEHASKLTEQPQVSGLCLPRH